MSSKHTIPLVIFALLVLLNIPTALVFALGLFCGTFMRLELTSFFSNKKKEEKLIDN